MGRMYVPQTRSLYTFCEKKSITVLIKRRQTKMVNNQNETKLSELSSDEVKKVASRIRKKRIGFPKEMQFFC